MKIGTNYTIKRAQSGVALFMSLIMLLVITVLGLSSVQTTTFQERMARNSRDTNLAFLAAEAALRQAEAQVGTFGNIDGTFGADPKDVSEDCAASQPQAANGYYHVRPYNCKPNWEAVDWTTNTGVVQLAAGSVPGVQSQPKYIVEHIRALSIFSDRLNVINIGEETTSGRIEVFRITAYGTGATDSAQAMLQVTYAAEF